PCQPITKMLKKSMAFKWTAEGRKVLKQSKKPSLSSPNSHQPDFSKDFILYAFGGDDTISAILVQQNKDNDEQPIAFFSQSLEDYE
ncbi:hypothetical protein KI387_034922, partial [Taxus chinensis]